MTLYPKLITDVLAGIRYPGNGKTIIEADMLDDQPHIDGMKVSFSIVFDKNPDPFMKSLFKSIEASIHREISPDVQVEITPVYRQAERPEPEKLLPGVKNIIAVSSGKGGVGKSTVSANLAVALAAQGYEVGLLDADVFGPSMPKMFSVESEQIYAHIVEGRQLLIPALKYGVKLLSVGFFVNPQTATLWRGSMASNTLRQLIADADWGELDYLIIDTPPGTSDIHLTLLQTLAITGAVIVSTPQQVALADARKGIDMYRNEKVNVPILGLVENMAWFTPAELPNNRYYIFGREGATRLAEELNVPVLAQPSALRPSRGKPSPTSPAQWSKPPNAAIASSIPRRSWRSRSKAPKTCNDSPTARTTHSAFLHTTRAPRPRYGSKGAFFRTFLAGLTSHSSPLTLHRAQLAPPISTGSRFAPPAPKLHCKPSDSPSQNDTSTHLPRIFLIPFAKIPHFLLLYMAERTTFVCILPHR